MGFRTWLLSESFDTVTDFLLNPRHRDKSFPELLRDFEASGGTFAGSGRFGQVFEHPSWPYVIKTFEHDDCYLTFVRFAYRNPQPGFPKFFGPPQRIVPFYKRTNAYLYVVRIEKLYPVANTALLKQVLNMWDSSIRYFYNLEHGHGDAHFDAFFAQYPQAKPGLEALYLLSKQRIECAFDRSKSNIMQRMNGQLVLTDPLWHGSNPYADYAAVVAREIDDYHDDEPDKYSIYPGGSLKRPKRPKPVWERPKPTNQDEIPF